MSDNREEWRSARDELASSLISCGFPAEIADVLARDLGSPRAILRMASYVRQARPSSMEMIADELIAIRSEIDAWRERKANQQAGAAYSRVIRYGIDDDPDD